MNSYDMQSLRLDEDNTLADEDEIHMAMVEFFENGTEGMTIFALEFMILKMTGLSFMRTTTSLLK